MMKLSIVPTFSLVTLPSLLLKSVIESETSSSFASFPAVASPGCRTWLNPIGGLLLESGKYVRIS